jgi:glycolate oxidase subunit GlcD
MAGAKLTERKRRGRDASDVSLLARLRYPTKVKRIAAQLREILGSAAVLSEPDELLVYECDGLPQHKYRPSAVVFPSTTEQTSAVMKLLHQGRVAFTPRGAGTGLSGGALALTQGVVIEMARMRSILKIDEANRIAVVQPGVVNLHVSRAVAHLGLHYVPDPSSQPTCTVGGNIAENAGGIHCLKYGTTTDHVLALRVVLSNGEIVDLNGGANEVTGYDLRGLFIGSEGTFGIATEATLRLVQIPPAVRTLLAEFAEVNDASHAVSAIIAAGVMPAALEMMDHEIIRAVEASVFAAGLPLDVGAALLIELDGIEAGLDEEAERVKNICLQYGARKCRSAQDETERRKLWAARKGAFGAIGRISPDSMIQDAVVPRSQLPKVLASAYQIASKYQLRIANVFHAGDGNLHPLICFDSRSPVEVHNVKEAGRELMETCVRAGGSITGEHGVGFDKRELLSLIFSEDDMDAMLSVRAAFDPDGLCNPGKIIPMLRGCGEARGMPNGQSAKLPASPANGSTPKSSDELIRPLPTTEISSGSTFSFDRDDAFRKLTGMVGERVSLSRGLAVFPESISETCEIMKLAARERWTVTPAGATNVRNATRSQVIISTRNLNRIVEHEPADLIAITEAGVSLRDFNATLAQKGQWLPLDPPDDGSATIGGVVATGLGGAQQFGYGPPRRHVIGMKVVLADGRLIKVGGSVVKNVAGYDLCKLFTGSYGTLGLIVEVNFKLRPLPFATATAITTAEPEELVRYAEQIVQARLFPVALEVLSPGMVSDGRSTHKLLIRFAGSTSGVQHQIECAQKLAPTTSGFYVDSADQQLWPDLAALSVQTENAVLMRASLPPASLREFMVTLNRSDKFSELRWQASAGDGTVRLITPTEHAETATATINGLRTETRRLGGKLTIESAPRDLMLKTDWDESNPALAIMRELKRRLDPLTIFASGPYDFL